MSERYDFRNRHTGIGIFDSIAAKIGVKGT
jgi:hypothetical protein